MDADRGMGRGLTGNADRLLGRDPAEPRITGRGSDALHCNTCAPLRNVTVGIGRLHRLLYSRP
jgi:hypothetical protein